MSLKQMALSRAGVCRECGVELPAKSTAVYDFTAKNVICLGCRGDDPMQLSRAARPVGSSTATMVDRRQGDRRSADRRAGSN